MSEKKFVGRNVVIALGILCIVLVAGLVGVIVNYTSVIKGKDDSLATLNSGMTTKDNTIFSLNAQIAYLKSHNTSSTASSTYQLQLIEAMNTAWNSTTAQPKFFVVGHNGLESSANITLPVNTLIEVTIVSYDSATPGSTDSMGVVSGTVGGNVYLINGTMASLSSTPQEWGQNMTAVPGDSLSHTFTIMGLGVNLPMVGGDTTIAYLYITKPGTYNWYCQTPCGFGPTGMEGAMSANSWMMGKITVS